MSRELFLEDLTLYIESLIDEYGIEVADPIALEKSIEELVSTVLEQEDEEDSDELIDYYDDMDDFPGE